jgi:hypothetical protein
MQLITVQKRLQALELALRQKIDFTTLLQEIIDQISVLKAEAEAAGEEDLAGIIGQVSAYFDTVSEGRLALNAEGLAIIRDFVLIFKDAIGDAAPGVSPLDKKQLVAWNSRYQALMARMEPVYEEFEPESEPPEVVEEEPAAEEEPVVEKEPAVEMSPVAETPLSAEYEPPVSEEEDEVEEEAAPVNEAPAKPREVPVEIGNQKESFVEFRAAENDESEPDEEELPSDYPSADIDERDVAISDNEFESVREHMVYDEPRPEFIAPEEMEELERDEEISEEAIVDRKPAELYQSPVQLEEIQLLKRKIMELHEKQEKLSSKVTGMLGDIKAAMTEPAGEEGASVEDMSIDELEDIIFIGRKKG